MLSFDPGTGVVRRETGVRLRALLDADAARVATAALEATDPHSALRVVDAAHQELGSLDVVLVAHGHLPDQLATERDIAAFERAIHEDGTSAVLALQRAAEHGERQGHGFLVAISSGAGALAVYPCFVSTPMTAYLPPRLRFIRAEDAGLRIHRAIRARRDELWIPRPWRLALAIARNVPEFLAKRAKSEARYLASLEQDRGADGP